MSDNNNTTRDDNFIPLPPIGKAERIERNGVALPSEGTISRQIWEYCNGVAAATRHAPTLAEVQAWGKGTLDPVTMQVQYYRWRKYRGVSRRARIAM